MARMVRVALRGVLGRKLRTALTALAIVLGVSMVTGTYILTDSINRAFSGIFQTIYSGTDATITGKSAFDISSDSNTTAPPFDERLLQRVRRLPDVADAVGGVGGSVQLIGKNGKAIVFGGAPNLGFSVDPKRPAFNSLTLVKGSWPGRNQVIVDTSTAGKKDLQVGQPIGLQAEGPVQRFRISGLVHFGGASSLGGATLAGFDLPTAQRLFAKQGKLDQIRISAKPGISPAQLVNEVRPILPAHTQVRTGTAQASKDAEGATSFTSFLQKFLLAFGGIALFVGSFVIANSLSITIAQRTREFATLRTIGASRRQVLKAVIVEAFVMGVLASITGVIAGLGLATGLFKLFDAVGFTLPNNGLVLLTRTVIVALAVGIIVTLLASLRPALRATRVPPIAAVREGSTLPPGRFARFRPLAALLLTLVGFAALVFGLFGPGLGTTGILLWMGVGALLIFLGVALLSARLVRPLAAVLGWPATRLGGISGALARDNSRRNPERTASTASALMIGLALVTLVAVLAAGITKSFRGSVDDLWNADYAITAQNNFSPIPISAADAVAKVPGVTAVANVRAGEAKVFGGVHSATAVNRAAAQVFNVTWEAGSQATLATLGNDGVFVDDSFAKDHHLHLGSPVTVTTPRGTELNLVLRGIFKPPTGGSPFGAVTFSSAVFDRNYDSPQNLYSFVRIRGGQTTANQALLDRRLKAFPNSKLQTKQQFIDNQISGLQSVLNILYVLLALSVLVSLFGIINTLVLTVFERTREIGMLRAVGMTRRQVRRMIRWESVITALLGGVIGIVLGIVLGGLLVARIDFIVFSLPAGSLIVFAIATVLVGMLAAIFPARRAARLEPLEALQYE
jgi:putative ABC transport system permease protein